MALCKYHSAQCCLFVLLLLGVSCTFSFVPQPVTTTPGQRQHSTLPSLANEKSSSKLRTRQQQRWAKNGNNDNGDQSVLVDQLIDEIDTLENNKNSGDNNNASTKKTNELLDELISTTTTTTTTDAADTNSPDFDSLMGYYNVSYTRTARANDNPVGGKWTRSPKFWNVKRTLQHVLPARVVSKEETLGNDDEQVALSKAVAQVVNVIRLDLFLLRKIVPIWIILRGDVIPLNKEEKPDETRSKTPLLPNLSNRAIRAYFDKPRIAIGKRFTFTLGPTSSVVIDTPYVDDRLRIGIGGTSGTKFVFKRILGDNDTEATDAWKFLLDDQTSKSMITKQKLSVGLAVCTALSGWAFWNTLQVGGGGWKRAASIVPWWKLAVGGLSTLASTLGLVWALFFSTGGIETNSDTYARGK